MSAKQKQEMDELLKVHSCALSDLTLCLAAIVAAKKYDDAAEALTAIRHKLNIVAGYVSQLLPVTKTTEAKLK